VILPAGARKIRPAGARKILRNPATLPPGKDECYHGTFRSPHPE